MKVSIITINYNSSEFTIKLVRSILANINSLSDYEIIIIDNASYEHEYKMLNSPLLPKNDSRIIEVYRNKVNNGFSGGNMDGYNKSSGEYLLFINNDCECKNDVLQPLIRYMQNNDKAVPDIIFMIISDYFVKIFLRFL